MILEEFLLNGQTALVTGADSLSGNAIVSALAEAGANIIAVANPNSPLDTARKLVTQHGKKILTINGNLQDEESVKEIVNKGLNQFSNIDILVNNEQIAFSKPLIEISPDEWRKAIDINLLTTFLFSKTVGAHMIKLQKGKVVNIASGMGDRGLENSSSYSTTMAGIMQMTSALSVEWGKYGIKVNAAGPVWFNNGEDIEDLSDPVLRYIPMRRKGNWHELGRMVIFLACDGSHFLTGKTLFLDGGVLSHA
jgi:NAD(P)-dependent dehydrogenase (short-subunit alcohol dehydrogenase family)